MHVRTNATSMLALLVAALAGCSGAGSGGGGAATGIVVEVVPAEAQIEPGGSVAFTGFVTGTSDATVAWQVVEADGGTIDAAGLYTAPAAAGTYHVRGASRADSSREAIATVYVGTVPTVDPSGLFSANRRTRWQPGIPGGVPSVSAIHTTIDAGTYGNGATDATAAINAAIQAAGAVATATNRQVVYLPAGTYRITGTINLDRDHVVLRGAGPALTRLRKEGGGGVVSLGTYPSWSAAVDVEGSVAQGASSFTVANASGISAGDLIVIDKLDEAAVVTLGGATWWKRGPGNADNGPASPDGYRSMGQTLEVASVSGNTIHVVGMLHTSYPAYLRPQIFRATNSRGVRYAGLEDLYVTGFTEENGITFRFAAYSWMKNVESDGAQVAGDAARPGSDGVHVLLTRTVRCVVRDSYVHHARSYITNRHAYGLTVTTQSSDNLVENNIVYYLNKNIVMEASGGGNVVAYNYVDDPLIATSQDWQEVGIDGSHLSHPYMELFEGNYTPHMGAASTHGSASALTFFRNVSSGQSLTRRQSSNVHAVQLDAAMRDINLVGNVLLHGGVSGAIYEPAPQSGGAYAYSDWAAPARVYWLGGWASGGDPTFYDPLVEETIVRHGNFDYVTNDVVWDPGIAQHELPASLYLTAKPAFFGTLVWPWVDPLGQTKTFVLPAKQRFDSLR